MKPIILYKPTKASAAAALEKYGWAKDVSTEAVIFLSREFPEWFAPDPDPVEEFIKEACRCCDWKSGCINESDHTYNCRLKRDALRAYVAELGRKAGEK